MPTPSQLPLVNRLIPEGVEQFLLNARNNGDSNRAIAAKLRDLHDINVTHVTIGAWCKQFGITKPEDG